jgi:hypothetical protein
MNDSGARFFRDVGVAKNLSKHFHQNSGTNSGVARWFIFKQKSQFGCILVGLGMAEVGSIFYDHLVYFTASWYGNLVSFGVIWYIYLVLVRLNREKYGNPGDNARFQSNALKISRSDESPLRLRSLSYS